MDNGVKHGVPEKLKTACIVVAVYTDKKLSGAAKSLDKASAGYLSKIQKRGDIKGNSEEALLLQDVPGIAADRILLVGCGTEKSTKQSDYISAVKTSISYLKKLNISEAASFLTDIELPETLAWRSQHAAKIALEETYQFQDFKSKPDTLRLKKITWYTSDKKKLSDLEYGCNLGEAIGIGSSFARDLGNTPGNVCHPSYLAGMAKSLAKEYQDISCSVLNEKQITALNMGALLSVAQGSQHPPLLASLEYKGAGAKQKPIVLVGKGITFDTGGNSLKPAGSMVGMKYDMCGSAAVLGTIKAVAELGLPVNVIGILAIAENMPGGTATRPDDIVTSMSGKTIEILNTDAEGRLVLADALTYAARFKPKAVIDIATLTGAAVVALGTHKSALYSNCDELAKQLLEAGTEMDDQAWRMPLGEKYHKQLDSDVADMKNIGGGFAGSITAACFLEKFATDYKWAHLDIAGTASKEKGVDKQVSGRPVPLLVQFLIYQCMSDGQEF